MSACGRVVREIVQSLKKKQVLAGHKIIRLSEECELWNLHKSLKGVIKFFIILLARTLKSS